MFNYLYNQLKHPRQKKLQVWSGLERFISPTNLYINRRRNLSYILYTVGSKSFFSHSQVISEIVSIDIGFQNAAWVHVDKDKQVLGWSRAEIIKPKPYNPAVFRPLVSLIIYLFIYLIFIYLHSNLDFLSNGRTRYPPCSFIQSSLHASLLEGS